MSLWSRCKKIKYETKFVEIVFAIECQLECKLRVWTTSTGREAVAPQLRFEFSARHSMVSTFPSRQILLLLVEWRFWLSDVLRFWMFLDLLSKFSFLSERWRRPSILSSVKFHVHVFCLHFSMFHGSVLHRVFPLFLSAIVLPFFRSKHKEQAPHASGASRWLRMF